MSPAKEHQQDKPLQLIKGIGADYDASMGVFGLYQWRSKVCFDTVMQDIVKFKGLQSEEDERFCEVVHLVKRSFNTLKEVGSQNDMDNSHMLSIIE